MTEQRENSATNDEIIETKDLKIKELENT